MTKVVGSKTGVAPLADLLRGHNHQLNNLNRRQTQYTLDDNGNALVVVGDMSNAPVAGFASPIGTLVATGLTGHGIAVYVSATGVAEPVWASGGQWVQLPTPSTAGGLIEVNVSANKTLGASDANTEQNWTSTSAGTITIPPDSTVTFPIGTFVRFRQTNSGTLTVAPGTGASLHNDSTTSSSVNLAAEGFVLEAVKTAANTWVVSWPVTTTGGSGTSAFANILDYGGVASATTDNGAALIAAAATGKPIWIPAGTFGLDTNQNQDATLGSFRIPQSTVRIWGEGTINLFNGAAGGHFYFWDHALVILMGISITAQYSITGVTTPAVLFQGCGNVFCLNTSFDFIYVQVQHDNTSSFTPCGVVKFTNCHFNNTAPSGMGSISPGDLLDIDCADVLVTGCTFTAPNASTTAMVLVSFDTHASPGHVVISGNSFYDRTSGGQVMVQFNNNLQVEDCSITGNTFTATNPGNVDAVTAVAATSLTAPHGNGSVMVSGNTADSLSTVSGPADLSFISQANNGLPDFPTVLPVGGFAGPASAWNTFWLSMDPAAVRDQVPMIPGKIYMGAFVALDAGSFNAFDLVLAVSGSAPTANQCYIGIYDAVGSASGNPTPVHLLGASAAGYAEANVFTGTVGDVVFANIAGGAFIDLNPGTLYYFALLYNGSGTMPAFYGATPATSRLLTLGFIVDPVYSLWYQTLVGGVFGNYTSLPANFDTSNFAAFTANSFIMAWA